MNFLDSIMAFEKWAELLRDAGFGCEWVEEEDPPVPVLYVRIGEDAHERPYFVRLLFLNDVAASRGVPEATDELAVLDAWLVFPYLVAPQAMLELHRTISEVNRWLTIGSLTVSEQDRRLAYRFQSLHEHRGLKPEVVRETLLLMVSNLKLYTAELESVALGERNHEAFLQWALAHGGLRPVSVQPFSIPTDASAE